MRRSAIRYNTWKCAALGPRVAEARAHASRMNSFVQESVIIYEYCSAWRSGDGKCQRG